MRAEAWVTWTLCLASVHMGIGIETATDSEDTDSTDFDGDIASDQRLAIGMRHPMPKALSVTFNTGGA